MSEKILQPWEAAEMLGVDPKTLVRWARAGKIEFHRTLGGHRRYRKSAIDKILNSHN